MATVLMFEGIDGCGKNTLIENVKTKYESLGKNVAVFEDGYHPLLTEDFKKIISNHKINNKERFLLMQTIRSRLYQSIIDYYQSNPDSIILVNRSIISSIVYQFFLDYFESVEEFRIVGFPNKYYDGKVECIEDEGSDFYKNTFTIKRFSAIIDAVIPFKFHDVLNDSIIIYLKINSETAIERDGKMCDYVHGSYQEKFNNLEKIKFFYDTILSGCEMVDYTSRDDRNSPEMADYVNLLSYVYDISSGNESFLYRLLFGIPIISVNANREKLEVFNQLEEQIGNILLGK